MKGFLKLKRVGILVFHAKAIKNEASKTIHAGFSSEATL